MDFFHRKGLKTKVERGQRVFPESDQAQDVIKILKQTLDSCGVKLWANCQVAGLEITNGRITGVHTSRGPLQADAVIVATGGLSYPGTGSTGDGYKWATQAGHTIIEPRPGLVPLITQEEWVKELQGLSLRNIKAVAISPSGKKISEEFGEMLFTHFGVSGPIILTMSADIGDYIYRHRKPVIMEIDLKPALSREQLDQRLQKDLTKYARKMVKNSLDDLLPQKLIPVIIKLAGIQEEKPCHQVNHAERLALLEILKRLSITIIGTRPVDEAIVTAGGVNVKEIDPKTMQSKLVKGLFFAGEVLDVDGYTGGYNLTAAFSTGYTAGHHAAQRVR
jgi:predicted Rossmann fold flavoprotein